MKKYDQKTFIVPCCYFLGWTFGQLCQFAGTKEKKVKKMKKMQDQYVVINVIVCDKEKQHGFYH